MLLVKDVQNWITPLRRLCKMAVSLTAVTKYFTPRELSFTTTLFSLLVTGSIPDRLKVWFSEIRLLDPGLLMF